MIFQRGRISSRAFQKRRYAHQSRPAPAGSAIQNGLGQAISPSSVSTTGAIMANIPVTPASIVTGVPGRIQPQRRTAWSNNARPMIKPRPPSPGASSASPSARQLPAMTSAMIAQMSAYRCTCMISISFVDPSFSPLYHERAIFPTASTVSGKLLWINSF